MIYLSGIKVYYNQQSPFIKSIIIIISHKVTLSILAVYLQTLFEEGFMNQDHSDQIMVVVLNDMNQFGQD